ncbi:MAG TPA: hypothetical protein VMT59_03060 [Gaiellaceae bacterium]|nr:hypothetical protein [Gaiellaceae bacterium]
MLATPALPGVSGTVPARSSVGTRISASASGWWSEKAEASAAAAPSLARRPVTIQPAARSGHFGRVRATIASTATAVGIDAQSGIPVPDAAKGSKGACAMVRSEASPAVAAARVLARPSPGTAEARRPSRSASPARAGRTVFASEPAA